MWHRTVKFAVVFTLLGGGIYGIPVAAQELQNWHWAPPIGLTENGALRIQFVAVEPRARAPETAEGICDVEVTVEIMDPMDLSRPIATSGPGKVMIGEPMVFDYLAQPGPAPAREEVVVRARVVRQPRIPTRRMALPRLCPLTSSVQVFDTQTGRTIFSIVLGTLDGDF